MGRQLYRLGWLVSVLLLSIPATVGAEVQEEQENSALAITQVESVQAESVEAEVAQGTTVQVTAVRLNLTADGLEVILETIDGQELSPATSVIGNALIADIPDAVLALPDDNEFQQANPIEGVALVSVTQRSDGIRVAITGTEAPPTADVRSDAQSLVLSVAPGTEAAETDEDAIQVVVTGEQENDGYAVDEATTATRTDTPLRDIPRSIQVIPQQVLEDRGISRITEAVRNVSGVTQDGGFGGTADQLNIRGFFLGNYFVDGFRTSGTSNLFETANLERIEVLKGPAAIVFGSVEPGGAINLVTEQPLEEPFYEVELQAGSYEFLRSTVDLTGPLNAEETLLYRLNLAYEHSDSFRDFDRDANRVFVAPVLEWRLSDNTDLTFNFTYSWDERPIDRGLVAFGRGVAGIPITRVLNEPGDFRRLEEIAAGYRFEHRFNDNWTIQNQFQFTTEDDFSQRADPLELNETTGILVRDYRASFDINETYALRTNVLGEFNTGFLEHDLLVGLDLQRFTSKGRFIGFSPERTPGINIFDPEYEVISRPGIEDLDVVINRFQNRIDSLGILAQDLISITDNFKLLLAGRFDIVDQEDRFFDEVSDIYEEAFSPTVGLLYRPIDPLSIYANYARSFQPNFGVSADGSFLEPERGTQYEIGIRAELFDRRLIANLAAYYLTKSNVATTDPDNPDFSIAIGEQRSQGIELDISGEILPGWNIIAAYTYIDAEITESNDFPVGARIANVPEHSASLWSTYEIQSGDLQGLGFGLGLYYVGERSGDFDFEESFELPSYFRTDAALFYRRDNWRAAINIQNLFDVEYFKANNYGRVAIEPGAPLTIIGSVTVEF
jgi:iron complex outermembrane recepter protein